VVEPSEQNYRLVGDVLSVGLETEHVLLSAGRGRYLGVRGAMRHLLDDLRHGLSLDEMVARTCGRYDVAPEVAKRDLEDMLDRLLDHGIVERAA
jgi:hypothetical protein